MLTNSFKITWRNIRRYKGYSFINISGLAIGMAVCIAIFLWVQDEITFDKFHKNADNIYRVVSKIENDWITSSPWAISEVLKKDFQEVSKATRYVDYRRLIRYKNVQLQGDCALVDKDFFEMFTFPFVKGDPQTAFNTVNSAVITEDAAVKYFADEDPVGKVIRINNQFDLTVTGVIKNVPSNSSLGFEFLINVNIIPAEVLQSWAIETDAYVLLHDYASVDDLRVKMSGTTTKYDKRIKKPLPTIWSL
jgi:putative ABC transport system permease protein